MDRTAKLGYWTDLSRELFFPLEIDPADSGQFDASVSIAPLGPILIAKLWSAPAAVNHLDKHLDHALERRFGLLMSLRGRMVITHLNRDLWLGEGDCVLLDQFASSHIVFAQPNQAITIQISEATLKSHVPRPASLCGRELRGAHGIGNTVGTMVKSVWDRVVEGLPSAAGFPFAHSLLELIATAYAIECGSDAAESTVRSARKAQIRQYIEGHLQDSDLSVEAIARSLQVSPRYVRMIFASETESVAAYVLRRRLERCAELICNPQRRNRTITEAAFDWGFSSTAHFSRAFRRHFGMSPTEYRAGRRDECTH